MDEVKCFEVGADGKLVEAEYYGREAMKSQSHAALSAMLRAVSPSRRTLTFTTSASEPTESAPSLRANLYQRDPLDPTKRIKIAEAIPRMFDSEASAIAEAITPEVGRAWWARQQETGKPAVAITDVPVRSFSEIEVVEFVDATPTAGTIMVGHAPPGTWQPRSRRQRRASR